MEAAARGSLNVTDVGRGERSSSEEPPGLRPARGGLQPIRDLTAFLQSLPEFGEEAQQLLEAVIENRAQRRKEAEERDC